MNYTKEEIFQQHEAELDRIDKEAHKARESARVTLRERLKALRAIEQKTRSVRRVSKNV